MPQLHFWTPEAVTEAELDDWNPDGEPERFASGLGHNVYELYVRLKHAGETVSIGEAPPPRMDLAVIFLKALSTRATFRSALRTAQRARGRFVVIRSDSDPGAVFPVQPLAEFVGAPSQVRTEVQRWLPPLPQRGLIARARERFGDIRRVAFKGNPENVPSLLRDETWLAALEDRGIELWLDAPTQTDGSDQMWHDFSRVDVVLALRHQARASKLADLKPPTRLINAWRAGCIPLCSREASYCDLAREDEDAFFVDGGAEVLERLDALRSDRATLSRAEERILVRREDFAPTTILQQWREALVDIAGHPGGARRRAHLAFRRARVETAFLAERTGIRR